MRTGTVFLSTATNLNSDDQRGCCSVSPGHARPPDAWASEQSGRPLRLVKCAPLAAEGPVPQSVPLSFATLSFVLMTT